jgi:hypothetical protein
MLSNIWASLSSENRRRLSRKLLVEMDREEVPPTTRRRLLAQWAASADTPRRRREETGRLAREVLLGFEETRHRLERLDNNRPIRWLAARVNGLAGRCALYASADDESLRRCLFCPVDELNQRIENLPARMDEQSDGRPPYLLFLNWIFDELGTERIENMKKGALEEEIRLRGPVAQFGPPSNNLITPMATILRSLEAKRGGAKRQQRTVH